MKEEILKRAMFAMPLSKDARNSGILSGFDMDEMGEMPEPEEASEEMPQMSRTPQNPEILMNTLRGDMRSVDARYQELAQMVGEEAAMETPPEVLAMLQMQLGAQQGGIGALPGAQGMMPPGAPPQPGQQPPAGPQGIAAAMPPGMASAPPFPQGGAEQAPPQQFSHGGAVEPPTPDGMPPMHAQAGAPVSMATRTAQWMGDKIGPYANAANVALGRFFMSPQFGVERMTGGAPAIPLTVQRGETLLMNPQTGQVFQGAGSRLAPYTSLSTLTAPTFTEGLGRGAAQLSIGAQNLAQQYPRLAGALVPVAAAGTWLDTMLSRSPQDTPENEARRQALIDQIPIDTRQEIEDRIQAREDQQAQNYADMAGREVNRLKGNYPGPKMPVVPAAPVSADPLGDFIQEKLAAQQERDALREVQPNVMAPKETAPVSRADRIKAARGEYAELYKELLGDTKSDMQTNALLMLADAGFKYAGMPVTPGSTPISRLSQAASGIPQGFMALLAQAKDRQIKVDTAALSQAVSDIQEQDKFAQQMRIKMLEGDYSLLREQVKQSGGTYEDSGAGMITAKTKGGGYVGVSIDPKNPTVQSAIASRFTLRPTDNPFIVNRGQAPTTVETNKEERIKLTNALRKVDNSIKQFEEGPNLFVEAFGPGPWFQDKVNNLLVPLAPGMVTKSGLDQVAAVNQIKSIVNNAMKSMAAANDEGRVSVWEQEKAEPLLKMFDNPTGFFENKELAAKAFTATKASMLNARQQILTQLGYEGNDYVMTVPSTGTKNDPFVIPDNKEDRRRMYNFLGSTVGNINNENAKVVLRTPDGQLTEFSPSQLKRLMQ